MTFIHTTPWAYYNDFDEKTCDWLEELIRQDCIAPGFVDRRSILEVQPDDLREFRQCHFFAGIAGWSYALRLIGWPDEAHVWTGSPPCFPAGVLVTTKRGFVPVEEVVVGDECLTHLGNWKPVVRIGSAEKAVVTLKGHGHFGLTTTTDHPFWSRERKIVSTRVNNAHVRKHFVADAKWRSASDMAGKWWAMPHSYGESKTPSVIGYSKQELGFLCGVYVGDGWVGTGHSENHVILGVNETKATEIEVALPRIRFSRQKARTGVRLVIADKELGAFLKQNFGKGSLTKSLPLWLIGANDTLRDAFVAGWDLTDGTRQSHSGSRRITTASRHLAITGRMLFVSMGYATSIRKISTPAETEIEGRVVSQADYYTINRSRCDRYRFNDDLHTWFKVKSVEGEGDVQRVYDLEVADDHSYVADGIVVHNCQPFSAAGRLKGKDDERHLAPKFAELVRACRPGLLFGEQVASAEVFGKAPKKSRKGAVESPQWAWLDDLLDRLEAARYAVGASDLPSASIGAPHIRQRTHFGAVNLEWLADADDEGLERRWQSERGCSTERAVGQSGVVDRLGDSSVSAGEWDTGTLSGTEAGEHRSGITVDGNLPVGFEHAGSGVLRMAHAQHDDGRSEQQGWGPDRRASDARGGAALRMADADSGLAGQRGNAGSAQGEGVQSRLGSDGCCDSRGLADADGGDTSTERQQRGGEQRQQPQDGRSVQVDHGGRTSPLDGPWRTADWLFCRDAKWRPVEARPQQMALGIPVDLGRSGDHGEDQGSWGRIAESLAQEEIGFPLGKVEYARATRLRGYGNAINPWLAAEFIASFLDALRDGADELSGQSPLELSKVRQRDMEDLL